MTHANFIRLIELADDIMKVQDFVNLISSCGFSPIPYSGHAMFGRQCVGVEMPIHGSIDFVKAMTANVPNDSRKWLESMLLNGFSDMLGQSMVFYWPNLNIHGIQFPDEN